MKIALFGASGMIGQRVALEALSRGHEVRGIVRDPSRIQVSNPHFTTVEGTISDPASVAQAVAGYDVVVNATGPGRDDNIDVRAFYSDSTNALLEGVKRAGAPRIITVGGAGSLEVAPGVQLVDTPDFPEAWRAGASALRDTLVLYRQSPLNWTFFSPAALIAPGQRTGTYRVGTDQLVTNDKGESSISVEDYAVALLDEIEKPRFERQRFTVAY